MSANILFLSGETKAVRLKTDKSVTAEFDQSLSRDASADFIGGAADQLSGDPLLCRECDENSVSGDVRSTGGEIQQSGDVDRGVNSTGESDVFQWSLAGIQKQQQADRDIRYISELLQQSTVKPTWESVALASHDVKTLWAQWPRLQIKDGLLKGRFESPDGLSVHWQVAWPSSLRAEFLRLAYGGMTGGYFGRWRSAAAVQSNRVRIGRRSRLI